MTDPDNPSALIGENEQPTVAAPTDPTQVKSARRRRLWLRTLAGLAVGVPLLLTLAGALTSPPHVKGVPVGHLIFLEADEPSDHTSLLRGLRIMGRDGSSQQLLHETEPQDKDAGSREWITQPKASPDGKWLAYEKQNITLQEEKQAIDNQLWVLRLDGPHPQPHLLLDLTKLKLKQFVGLVWTADGRSVVFLNDAFVYTVALADGRVSRSPLLFQFTAPAPTTPASVSVTQYPMFQRGVGPAVGQATPELWCNQAGTDTVYAVTPNGETMASVVNSPSLSQATITTYQEAAIDGMRDGTGDFNAHWGWSVYGKRHITQLKWSPDGKYLAYSVSKPPFEDELFYIDLATGRCYQLPVRTGSAGWDWAP